MAPTARVSDAGAGGAPDPSSSSAPAHVDDTLVAGITTYPDVTVGRVPPDVSVYADGRVITVVGYETVTFVVRRLTDTGLATLVAALDTAVPRPARTTRHRRGTQPAPGRTS